MKKSLAALTILLVTAGLAATPTPAEADDTGSITVFLKAPDPTALTELADNSQGLSRAQRLTALQGLVPSNATRQQVANTLRSQGYTITGETSWSVTASGSTATSARLFGRSTATSKVAARALPRVPATLSSNVSAAFPTTGGAPAYRPRATGHLAGPDYRNANTPATVAPTTGQNDAGATIATLQLSNFQSATGQSDPNAGDLTAYATKYHLADPVANGQYKAVKVDGGAVGSDDYGEVNLDQQSILSTAPTANQHAYFAPNTNAGYNDVFAAVFDDVTGATTAKLPDPHIVAMSVSWGECESMTGAAAILSLEPILQSLVAAGVTVFASSGDDGIYDCGSFDDDNSTSVADVDYPASSPYVVGVGGTYLHAASSTPNTGTNWTESAWSCVDPDDCELSFGSGGSGGGASGSAYAPGGGTEAWGGFPAPAYQQVALDTAPYAHNAKRLVPDIATAGDPTSGFVTLHAGLSEPYGGTSLASPVSAAQLTNALSDVGRKTGVGDIHGALYSAYRLTRSFKTTNPKKPFRDIVSGRNGLSGDKTTDPSVFAAAGYDTVSGVGAPLWSALVPTLLDTKTPTVKTTRFTAGKSTTPAYKTIKAAWTVSRGADTSLVGANYVQITRLGTTKPVWTSLSVVNSHAITAVPGSTYQVKVIARDLSGRAGTTKTATVSVPLDDTAMKYSGSWVRQSGSGDIGGSNIYANATGATATATATASAYSLRYRTGPAGGKLGVYVGGYLLKTIDQHSAKAGYGVTSLYSGTRAKRTFTFRALSTKTVHLDALYVAY